jgi:hypothetical protein
VSLTSPIPDENGIAFTAVGRECLYCSGALSDPAVYWMGHGGEVYLHPACVTALAVRLFRDVHEVEKPTYYIRRGLR